MKKITLIFSMFVIASMVISQTPQAFKIPGGSKGQ